MNSKQRRQEKRRSLRMAIKFTEVIEQLLDDLESGNHTFESARENLSNIKQALSES